MSKKAYIFLADGFEDIEGLTVVDLLRRAGIDIKTISIKETTRIQTSHGITMLTDAIFAETDFADADMLVLPGGMPGTLNLQKNKMVTDAIEYCVKNEKLVAAICAAPMILGDLGYLDGKNAVCFPGFEDSLTESNILSDGVVRDGNFITAKGAGKALEFGAAIVDYFSEPPKGERILQKMQV